MRGDTRQQYARDRVGELPGAGPEHPSGSGWEVFKVRGKVVMLMTDVTGEPIVRADPQDSKALRVLVVENLPRAKRPADPDAFDRRDR